ncbi:MAG: phosphatase PAP2 family protein [Rhodospirillaceae bacterium]|nr:phosphatase PAP2 family protein [Rhodospirillaceae bacterium]
MTIRYHVTAYFTLTAHMAHGLVAFSRRYPWTSATLGMSLLCTAMIAWADLPLAHALRNHLPPDTYGFFKVLTNVGLTGLWYVLAAALLLGARIVAGLSGSTTAHDQFMNLARSAWFIIAAMATSGILGQILKFCVGRYRPRYLFEEGLYGVAPFGVHMGMYSFPSGHTQTVVAAMTALMLIYPRYNLLYILIAVLIGSSRALTTIHYPSDVLMGAYIGFAVTMGLRHLFERNGHSLRIDR